MNSEKIIKKVIGHDHNGKRFERVLSFSKLPYDNSKFQVQERSTNNEILSKHIGTVVSSDGPMRYMHLLDEWIQTLYGNTAEKIQTIHERILFLERDDVSLLKGYYTNYPGGHESPLIFTVDFGDGMEVDVECCPNDEETPPYMQAVLYDHGGECSCSDTFELSDIQKDVSFSVELQDSNNDIFVVTIVMAEKIYTYLF